MNRKMLGADRVIVALLGLLLLAGGAWLVAWGLDRLIQGWWSPRMLLLGIDPEVAETGWWPWALMLGGLLLAGIGGAWLMNHFRNATVARLSLPGDPEGGRIVLDGSALADGMAAALTASAPEILGAGGRLLDQGGGLMLDMKASIRPDADLRRVQQVCDSVIAHTLRSTGRQDLRCRIRFKVAPSASPAARVH